MGLLLLSSVVFRVHIVSIYDDLDDTCHVWQRKGKWIEKRGTGIMDDGKSTWSDGEHSLEESHPANFHMLSFRIFTSIHSVSILLLKDGLLPWIEGTR
jgi:hypothetical protein